MFGLMSGKALAEQQPQQLMVAGVVCHNEDRVSTG